MLLEGLLLLILLKTFESSKFPSVFEILVNDTSMTPADADADEGGGERVVVTRVVVTISGQQQAQRVQAGDDGAQKQEFSN